MESNIVAANWTRGLVKRDRPKEREGVCVCKGEREERSPAARAEAFRNFVKFHAI